MTRFSVLHVSFEYGDDYIGGLGTFLNALTDQQKEKHDISVVLPRNDGKFTLRNDVYSSGINLTKNEILERLKKGDYNIIHFHDWHGWHLAKELENLNYPIVFTCHLPSIFEGYNPNSESERRMFAEKLLVDQASLVVGNSKYTIAQLSSRHHLASSKSCVILNGVNERIFHSHLNSSQKKITAIAAGRLVEQKGMKYFVEACNMIKEAIPCPLFVIAGEGYMKDQLMVLVRDLGMADSFKFLGKIDQLSLAKAFRSSRIAVVPSIFEPFGLVAAEAMLCGTPVIASDTGGLREIIEHGHNGILVEVSDPDAIAAAMMHLNQSSLSRNLLSKRAILDASNEFSMEVCAKNYELAYASTLLRAKKMASP